MGFSNAGLALEACANNGLPDQQDRPTQLFNNGQGNDGRDDRGDKDDRDDRGDRNDDDNEKRKAKRPVANCTCKFPVDCEVPICRHLKQFKKRCDISPSSLMQNSSDVSLSWLVNLQVIDQADSQGLFR